MTGRRAAAGAVTVLIVGGGMLLGVAAAAQQHARMPGAGQAGSSRPAATAPARSPSANIPAGSRERGQGGKGAHDPVKPAGVPASTVGKLLVNDTGNELASWPRQARGGESGSISHSHGVLYLSTTGANGNGYSIISPHTYTSGIFEARIYFPGARDGKVADWPAFWLSSAWSGAVGWPDGGEMDLAEGLSGVLYDSYHYGVQGSERSITKTFATSAPGWHTITGVWKADEWEVYYDGKLVKWIFGPYVANHPMNVILSQYQGNLGNQPGVAATLRISYLRIWSVASS